MQPSAVPKTGFWTNHDRRFFNRFQILATDHDSQILAAFIAVCLTLVGVSLYTICQSFYVWLTVYHHRVTNADGDVLNEDDETPLLASSATSYGTQRSPGNRQATAPSRARPNSTNSSEASRAQLNEDVHTTHSATSTAPIASNGSPGNEPKELPTTGETVLHSESTRHLVWNGLKQLRRQFKRKPVAWSAVTSLVLAILLFVGIFIAWTIAGIVFPTLLVSNDVALSSSTRCGIWMFNDEAGDDAAYLDDLQFRQEEARASQYVRDCFGSESEDTQGCSFFYNQSISFTTKRQEPCPFHPAELCHGTLYSAITFDTGLVDASTIGINAEVTHKFRRKTTCSPLNMTDAYIRKVDSDKSNETTFRYYYGPKDDTEYTFETSGNPFALPVPAYTIKPYFSSQYPEYDPWKPLPGLKPSKESTLTIMFISSLHIYNTKPSYDPIFPAHKPENFPGYREPFYYNSNPRARALACLDTTQVCSPDGKICWSMIEDVPSGVPSTPAYWLMKWSLELSDTYDSIAFRLGSALLAQEKISQSISSPLSDKQWEIEAGHMFATSLARIQYDAWKIATGQDWDRPGYVEMTPDDARGKLCGLYKFKALGYKNVNALGFFGLIALASVLFIIGCFVKRVVEVK